MIKNSLIVAVVLSFLSTPVLAFHCPADVHAIDAALQSFSLPDDVLSKVIELRDIGDAQHSAGKHTESILTLAEAMRLILNNL